MTALEDFLKTLEEVRAEINKWPEWQRITLPRTVHHLDISNLSTRQAEQVINQARQRLLPSSNPMTYTPVNPCKICHQNNQKPKTIGGEVFWVHCDSCGNRGKEATTPHEAATNWNKENPQ